MKTQNTKLTRKGVTLIELTVVIAVILTLIGILFIGAQTYQRQANKSACIVLQNGINKAVRSFANFNSANTTGGTASGTAATTWNFGLLSAQELLPATPNCPQSGAAFTAVNGNVELRAGTVFSPCPTFAGGFTGLLTTPTTGGGPATYSITDTTGTVPDANMNNIPIHVPNLNKIGGW